MEGFQFRKLEPDDDSVLTDNSPSVFTVVHTYGSQLDNAPEIRDANECHAAATMSSVRHRPQYTEQSGTGL